MLINKYQELVKSLYCEQKEEVKFGSFIILMIRPYQRGDHWGHLAWAL